MLNTRVEITGCHRDGNEIPIELAISPALGQGGAYTFNVFVRDLSEQKRAEKQFHALLESAPDAHVIVNEGGTILRINRQTETLFGYAREELEGQSIELLVPERFRGNLASHRAGFFAYSQAQSIGAGRELYALRKDGSEFHTEVSLNPLETDEGPMVVAAIRDVSERTRVAKALRESEEKFRTVADWTYDWETWDDPQGQQLYSSPSVERITGYRSRSSIRILTCSIESFAQRTVPDGISTSSTRRRRLRTCANWNSVSSLGMVRFVGLIISAGPYTARLITSIWAAVHPTATSPSASMRKTRWSRRRLRRKPPRRRSPHSSRR